MIDSTLIMVLIGIGLLGMVSGVVGVFVLLRGQSLLGDAIAHASLPGIVLAFLYTESRNIFILLGGGVISAAIGLLFISVVTASTRLKKDAIQGMVLSVFFGLGLVLLTVVQKRPISHQSVLNKFLFGNVATLLYEELYGIALVTFFILLGSFIFWKELLAYIFDAPYLASMGFTQWVLNLLLSSIMLCTIVIGLQGVGVVLMSTMLIAPAVAARQLTDSVSVMVGVSGFLGGLAGIIGVSISSYFSFLPTGPLVVIIASIFVILSFIGAPYKQKIGALLKIGN